MVKGVVSKAIISIKRYRIKYTEEILVIIRKLSVWEKWMFKMDARGGGGTASLKVGTHSQTTAPAFWPCPPLSFL